MECYKVVETIYLNNDHDKFLKYEILSNGHEEFTVVSVYAEIKIQEGNLLIPTWGKIGSIPLDHLDLKPVGFQQNVGMAYRSPKTLSSVIDECKKHRSSYKD